MSAIKKEQDSTRTQGESSNPKAPVTTIKKERKPWTLEAPSTARNSGFYSNEPGRVASSSRFKVEDLDACNSEGEKDVKPVVGRKQRPSEGISRDDVKPVVGRKTPVQESLRDIKPFISRSGLDHSRPSALSFSRRDDDGSAMARRQSRPSAPDDNSDSMDDFAIEAEMEAQQYLEAKALAGTKKKKRGLSHQERFTKLLKDVDNLCPMFDPSQTALPPKLAREIVQRSQAEGSKLKSQMQSEALKRRELDPIIPLVDGDSGAEDEDEDGDDWENDNSGESRGALADNIGATTFKSDAGSSVKAESFDGPIPMPPPPPQSPPLPRSPPRYRPLIVKKEDIVDDNDSGDSSEEDMFAPRRPAPPPPPPVRVKVEPKDEPPSTNDEHLFAFTSTSQRSTTQSLVKSESKPKGDSDTDDDDEEMFILTSARPAKLIEDIPLDVDSKPFFPIKPEHRSIGPLVLDAAKGIKVPASINRHLRDYQRDGIRFLYRSYSENRGGVLGDDMGLGKTVQVIGFLAAIMKKTGGSRDLNRRVEELRLGRVSHKAKPNATWPTCLIICPQSVLGNWQSELETWGYFEHAVYGSGYRGALEFFRRGQLDIVLSSHEYARNHIEALKDMDWTVIIADEAHKFKNPRSQMTRAMNLFQCKLRFGLTGTAIQNRYKELWCLLDWTHPGRFGCVDAWEMMVSLPIKLGQRKSATREEAAEGQMIADLLAKNFLPELMLRRTKALIADQLPKKYDKVVFCPLAPEQLRAYRDLMHTQDVEDLRLSRDLCECGAVDDEGAPYRRGKCCRPIELRAIFRTIYLMCSLANHAALFFPSPQDQYDEREVVREKYVKQLQYTKELWPDDWPRLQNNQKNGFRTDLCGKWQVLTRLLKTWHANGDKVLLFSHSLRLLNWLEWWIELAGYKQLRLDGSTPQGQRQGKVNEFNRDPSLFIFLISTMAGGTGLNLTGANKVVIFDPNWNPAHDMQAMDRAYRIGQARDVHVYRLVGAGTLEEIIYGRQIYKVQAANIGYTASKERRFFDGVEGIPSMPGELFGMKNMFTLREDTCSITKEIIEDCDLAETAAGVEQFRREAGAEPSGDDVEDAIFERGGIEYSHNNGDVLGGIKRRASGEGKKRAARDRVRSESWSSSGGGSEGDGSGSDGGSRRNDASEGDDQVAHPRRRQRRSPAQKKVKTKATKAAKAKGKGRGGGSGDEAADDGGSRPVWPPPRRRGEGV